MNSDAIIAAMRATASERDDEWRWRRFLEELDKAGYAVVAKPTLIDRGRPAPREW